MEIECVNCGRTFKRKPFEVKRRKLANFCSYNCYKEYIKTKPLRWKVSAQIEEKIIKLYKEGKRPSVIAREVGISGTHVRNILKSRYGVLVYPKRALWHEICKIPDDDVEKGYLAAAIDGEGSIEFKQSKRDKTTHVYVEVFNTNFKMIERLYNNWGGTLYERRKGRPNWKTGYIWGVYRSFDVYKILKVVLPYLSVKRERAERGLKLLADTISSYGY
ncbi:MAG: hypothetical protein QXT14_02880 [Candidatus Bathyarchaeia archaeon]